MSAASLCIMGDDESGSEEISDTEIDSFILDKDMADEANEFLFAPQAVGENCGLPDFQPFDAETHERLQALLQAAGISKIPNGDGSGFGETDRFQQAADALTKVAAGSELLPTASKAKSNPAKNPLSDKGLNSSSSTQPDSSAEEGESLLSLACSAGYYELAQVLLAMRTNVEDRGVKGDCTPLMEAASAGHVDIVNLLIANGADVNAQSSTGNSPLMYACAGGHEPVVRRLLEAGANLEIHNENGHTALMEAASAGHVSIARLLVQSGASINTHSNEFKESALTLACYKGHLEMVKHLLEAGSQAANKEHRVEEMHTALMEASMDGHVEVAQLLLDNGAQVNMPADSFESPLTLAACGGHTELAKLLIDRGANIEEVNDEGYTPLMEAAREGHEDMVALLLSCESDVNAQTDETGETALTLACCGGFLEVASLLIKAGANCEMGANTPLMEAAQEGHVEVVKFLLKQDCNVNASTATGDTALTYAAENGHTDVCASLIDAGADLEHTAEGGRTALMKSSRAGHLCTVQFLVAKGAQINRSTSANDHTALSLACVGGHSAIVEFLLQRAADPNHKLKDSSTMLIEAAKGGHTTVVQLLLDWPGTVLPSQFPTAQMSVGDMSALQLAKIPLPTGANLIRPEATGVPPYVLAAPGIDSGFVTSALNGNLDPNVLAQYNRIALAASIAATKNVGDVSQDSGDKQSTASPPQYSMVCPVSTPGLASLSTQPPVAALLPTSYVPAADAMQSVQKAMLRHAGEKLNPLELQQLQEQLRTQFQQAAAVAANMIQQSNTPAAVATDTSDGHGDSHNSSAVASSQSVSMAKIAKFSVTKTAAVAALRCKEAELQAAMKELERLKKTQQIYEELQMAGKELLEKGVGDDKEAEWLQQAQQHLKQQQQKLERQTQQQQKQLSLQQKQQSATPPVPMTPASPSPPPDNTSVVGQSDLTSTGVDVVFPPVTGANATPLNPPTVQWQNLLTAKLPDYPVPPSAQSSNTPLVGFQFVPTSALPLPPVPQSVANSNDGDTSSSAFVSLLQTQLTIPPSEDGTNSVPTELKIELSTEALSSAANSNCGSASFTFQLSPSQGFYFANPSEVTTEVRANLQLIPPSPTGLPSKQEVKKMEPILSVSTSSVPVPVSLVRNDVVTSTTMAHSSVAIQTVDSSYTAACRKPSHLDNVDHPAVARRRPVFSSKKDGVSGGSAPQPLPPVDLNTQTESNHDTALTLACAGGHTELVSLLLTRGADLEHRDKKGFTPLILASTAGHATVVEILLEHGADIEAQSERTKDTALSLACSGGRKEVVEVLLKANANKEHRNVSDYTPLSLAASGGYVEIINLLLNFGAEINSRTGSKLGISPLMLAAMNGHSQAVKVLLERGSDINAQIETNRNTALTLACFQGRHEVVKLLLDYRANVEHRAKTGLTPLMEAANGGYVEVGRVLLQYGADVNASPVPSSKDTALTVAADKGHYKFVELLIQNGALVDVKNKKGNSPLWLASNGGHLDVVQALVRAGADLDSHDNRKVTPLMTAFRKGHVKVVRWMVKHVFQYPSDQDCLRYITTVTDKEAQTKCHECLKIITTAKDRQAEEANKNAKILLLEIEKEAALAETRKLAKLRQKEKKKQKRKAKKDVQLRDDGKEDEEDADEVDGAEEKGESSPKVGDDNNNNPNVERRCGTPESTEVKGKEKAAKSRVTAELITDSYPGSSNSSRSNSPERRVPAMPVEHVAPQPSLPLITSPGFLTVPKGLDESGDHQQLASPKSPSQPKAKKTYTIVTSVYENSRLSNGSLMVNPLMSPGQPQKTSPRATSSANEEWSSAAPRKSSSRVNSKYQRVAASRVEQKRPDDQADEWKEVKKKANKLTIASQYIARVIGRSGNNINAIRESTGAHIEVEKQQKGQTERTITIRGSSEAMRQALLMINGLVNEQDAHVNDIIQKVRKSPPVATSSSKGSDSGKDVEPVEIKKTPIPPTNGAVLSSKNFPEISVWSSQVTGKSAVAGNRSGAARKQTVSKPKLPESATSVPSTNVTTRTTAAAVVKGQNVWAKRGENGQPLDFASVIKGTGGTNSTGVWKQPHSQAQIPTENPTAPPPERFTTSTNAAEKVFSGSLRLAPDFTSAPRSTGKENDQQVNAATEDSVAKERSDVSSTGFNTGGHELPLQVLNQLDQLRNALKLPEFSGGLRSFDPSADDSLSNQFDQIAGVPSHISPVLYNSDSSKPSPHLSNQQYAGYHADGFDALGGYQPASNRNSTAFSDPIESGHPSMNDSSEITTKFFKPISLPRPASATPHLGPKIDHLEDMKPPASSFSPPLDPSAHESGSLARPPGLKPIGMERRNRGPNVSRLATYMQDNNSTSNTDDSQINSWPSQFSATSADLDVDWRMKMLDQSVSQLSMGLAQAQLQQAQNDNVSNLIDYNRASQMADYGSRNAMQHQMTTPSENLLDSSATQFGSNTMSSAFQLQKLLLDLQNQRAADSRRSQQQQQMVNGQQSMQNFMNLRNGPPGFVPLSTANLVPMTEIQSSQPVFQPLMSRPKSFFQVANPQISAGPAFLDPMAPIFTPSLSRGGMIHTTNVVQLPNFVQFANQPNHQTSLQPQLRQLPQNVFVTQLQPHLNGLQSQQQHQSVGGNSVAGVFQNGQPVRFNGVFANPDQLWAPLGQQQNRTMGDSQADQIGGGQSRLDHFDGGQQQQHQMWGNGWSSMSSM